MKRTLPFILLLAACGGVDEPPADDSGEPPVAPVAYEPTWAGMQQLFDDHCNRCHPAVNGIDLVEETPHQLEPEQEGYLPWITPGKPDESWMWLLVTGDAGFRTMPSDGLLPLETLEPMRVWIESGASFE